MQLPINTHKIAIGLTTLLLSVTSTTAYAEESRKSLDKLMTLSLDNLFNQKVSVASKRLESSMEAPGIITLITSDEIERFGYQNLYDVLERIPNTYPHYTHSFPENNISVRGMDQTDVNHHTLVLLNGRPFRDSISGGFNSPIYTMFPVNMVEHIEVIRGPGSVLYGTNAFGAVINIVTKTLEEDGREGELNAYYGSFDSGSVALSGAQRKGDFFAQGGVLNRNSNGWTFDFTDATGRNDYPKASSEGNSLFFNMDYGNFSAQGYSGYTNNMNLGQSFFYPVGEVGIRRKFLDVGYEDEIADTGWIGSANLTYNGANLSGSRFLDMNSDDFLTEATLRGEILEGMNAVFGGTYDHLNGSLKASGGKADATRWSLYGQLDYRPVDWLKLIGGLQFNKVNGKDSDISPRVGTIVNFTDEFGMKLLYSEAFRSPAFGDTNLALPFQIGDPNIKPERVATTDLQLFYQAETFSLRATAYQSRIDDIVIVDFIGAPGASLLQIQNGTLREHEGIEFEGKYYLDEEWMAIGSVSYQTGDNNAGNNNDAGIGPNLIAKFGVSYKGLDDGLTFGVYDQYSGAPDNTVDTAPPYRQVVNPEGEAHHIVSANASLHLNRYLDSQSFPDTTLSLYGENLLDEEVYYPNFVSQTTNTYPLLSGRAVYAKVKIKF